VTEPIRTLSPTNGNGFDHDPSFTELVYAHYAWWQSTHEHPENGVEATRDYRDVLRRFEKTHGQLIHTYWCSHLESAVALSDSAPKHRWQSHRYGFHRASDWATKSQPTIAAQLHRCDDIAVRAQAVLTGVRQRICLQLVAASAAHLLSVVDGPHEPQEVRHVVALEKERLDKVDKYYREAANGQAQIMYFGGMAVVAGLIAVVVPLLIWWQNWKPGMSSYAGLAALAAGAIGAVVSVTQRINHGDFDLDYDVGRGYAFFLGGLRPIIGGTFAVVITFAIRGGLLHLPISTKDPTTHEMLGLLVVAFVAGFSERWAQDTITATVPKSPTETTTASTTTTEGP
jgi:hypothetical protein